MNNKHHDNSDKFMNTNNALLKYERDLKLVEEVMHDIAKSASQSENNKIDNINLMIKFYFLTAQISEHVYEYNESPINLQSVKLQKHLLKVTERLNMILNQIYQMISKFNHKAIKSFPNNKMITRGNSSKLSQDIRNTILTNHELIAIQNEIKKYGWATATKSLSWQQLKQMIEFINTK